MTQIFDTIRYTAALLGGFLGWVLGGFDGFIYALFIFVCIDCITGVMCAVFEKKLSSKTGFKGICKKVVIFMLVAIGHIFDALIIGDGSVMRTAVIFFYLSNEGISILENVTILDLPVPKKLKEVLEQLREEEKSNEN